MLKNLFTCPVSGLYLVLNGLFETVRSLTVEGIAKLEKRMTEMTKGISAAFNCEMKLTFDKHYPPTVNDAGAYKFAMETAKRYIPAISIKCSENYPTRSGISYWLLGDDQFCTKAIQITV